jgi:hypothetical protein
MRRPAELAGTSTPQILIDGRTLVVVVPGVISRRRLRPGNPGGHAGRAAVSRRTGLFRRALPATGKRLYAAGGEALGYRPRRLQVGL